MRLPYVGVPSSLVDVNHASLSLIPFAAFCLASGLLGGFAGVAPFAARHGDVGTPQLEDANAYLPPTHLAVWPTRHPAETAAARLERLEVPSLDARNGGVVLASAAASAEPRQTARPLLIRHRRHAAAFRTTGANKTTQSTRRDAEQMQGAATPLPLSLLDQIRSDPHRIYVEDSVKIGNLKFGVRNVSPEYGVEVWVSADEYLSSPVYYPKARVGGVEAEFEGQMLAAGQKYFGSIPISDLRRKNKVDIVFSAAGIPERKATVKLEW